MPVPVRLEGTMDLLELVAKYKNLSFTSSERGEGDDPLKKSALDGDAGAASALLCECFHRKPLTEGTKRDINLLPIPEGLLDALRIAIRGNQVAWVKCVLGEISHYPELIERLFSIKDKHDKMLLSLMVRDNRLEMLGILQDCIEKDNKQEMKALLLCRHGASKRNVTIGAVVGGDFKAAEYLLDHAKERGFLDEVLFQENIHSITTYTAIARIERLYKIDRPGCKDHYGKDYPDQLVEHIAAYSDISPRVKQHWGSPTKRQYLEDFRANCIKVGVDPCLAQWSFIDN